MHTEYMEITWSEAVTALAVMSIITLLFLI
jgi:hypothetical protein